jgi:two-component sensor histidine kinase
MFPWQASVQQFEEPPAGAEGYGSKLLNRSVSGQLGVTITYDWSEKGVVVVLRLSVEELAK